MTESGYEYFEHTADVGLRVWGRSLDELFVNAARGMIGLLVEQPPTEGPETHPILLEADTPEALLRLWLKELLFWFQSDKFVSAVCHIQVAQETLERSTLRGWIDGARFDAKKHVPGTEIKGVTYHNYQLQQIDDGWKAEVIFDV